MGAFFGAIIALIVMLVVIFGPFITIWAMNTLFPVLAIPYTLETWVAALIIGSLISARVNVRK